MAKQLEMSWWENLAMKYLIETPGGARLNTAAWLRSMAARFPREYRRASNVDFDSASASASAAQLIEQVLELHRRTRGAGKADPVDHCHG